MADLPLNEVDPEIAQCIADEERRQHEKLRLIPSENYASAAVMEACGSVLNNKYSEGYAGKRYYEGQQNIDRSKCSRSSGSRLCSASTTRTCSPTPARRRTSPSTSRSATPATRSWAWGYRAAATSRTAGRFRFPASTSSRSVRRPARRQPHRLRSGRVPGARAQAEAALLWCNGVPARGRLREVRRDRARGWVDSRS